MKPVLNVGLVNNMPDAALEPTERQFVALLQEAAQDDMTVLLELYTLPLVPRGELGRQHLSCYHKLEDLWRHPLDGIIVTGTEPRARELEYEPYWGHMARLVDWAAQNTTSAIWSCLAAHAAVLHLDGIRRCRRAQKRFGIFNCVQVRKHFLNAGRGEEIAVPHSRWNGLSADELKDAGYEILTQIGDEDVDSFVRQNKSLHLFLQGHPEYETDTLLREYRRDLKRFLRGESEVLQTLPKGYSNPLGGVVNTWHADAVRLYRNWLCYLAEHKSEAVSPAAVHA
ncbi:MAG TPA: homoserine O-succinyltransferase [Verrucomicrobiae bacterium]|nr:homoserine O-succinyltransferase [Verrucomicrobiae bacterium]